VSEAALTLDDELTIADDPRNGICGGWDGELDRLGHKASHDWGACR
jgi:hypothetical protein